MSREVSAELLWLESINITITNIQSAVHFVPCNKTIFKCLFVYLIFIQIRFNKENFFYSENIAVAETTSRDSPLSIISSQSNRRCDGVAFVPICLPPSYQPPKEQAVQQINPSPLLPTAVQVIKYSDLLIANNNNMGE